MFHGTAEELAKNKGLSKGSQGARTVEDESVREEKGMGDMFGRVLFNVSKSVHYLIVQGRMRSYGV